MTHCANVYSHGERIHKRATVTGLGITSGCINGWRQQCRVRTGRVSLPMLDLQLANKLAIFIRMSTTVNVAEFKNHLTKLLALVEKGGEVIVCRRNVPLARLEPVRTPAGPKPARQVVGCMKGTVQILDDLTEPCIPEQDWAMLN